jgi:modification methylase
MIWAARSASSRYSFNYEAMKAGNDDLQLRSDWFLPICTGDERLKDAGGAKLHPTQKPEALLARILLSSSKPGDVILDPFFGTGTTGAVAKALGRQFIGLERDTGYAAAAERRIAAVTPLPAEAFSLAPAKRSEPRIPFLSLIEGGLVTPGESVIDLKGRHNALVRADGTLALGPVIGSIHKVGALAQGLPSCNGWTFWHVERQGAPLIIDALRDQIRARGA